VSARNLSWLQEKEKDKMRVAFLLVSILFALAVAEQQQQEPQPSYDESQASYGPYFYHPAERQFVPSNAKWFIRTTTTSTSTSKAQL